MFLYAPAVAYRITPPAQSIETAPGRPRLCIRWLADGGYPDPDGRRLSFKGLN